MLKGRWGTLPLAVKAPLLGTGALGGLAGLAVAGVTAWSAVWGSAQVRVENLDCDPLVPPSGIVRTLANLLPVFEAPDEPIGSGASGVFRLPAGDYRVEVTPERGEARWLWLTVGGEFPGRLRSLQWDGQELVGRGQVTLSLEKGSSHTVQVSCGG